MLSIKIDNTFAGIIWLVKDQYHWKQAEDYYTLDYFFDGLLTNKLATSPTENSETQFFATDLFRSPFFLMQTMTENLEKKEGEIVRFMDFLKNLKKEKHQENILIISEVGKHQTEKLIKTLSNKFSAFSFSLKADQVSIL